MTKCIEENYLFNLCKTSYIIIQACSAVINEASVVEDIVTLVHSIDASDVTDADTASLTDDVIISLIFSCDRWLALVDSECC